MSPPRGISLITFVKVDFSEAFGFVSLQKARMALPGSFTGESESAGALIVNRARGGDGTLN